MPQLQTLSLSELVQHANRWDDLWLRSEARLPTKTANGIRLWCESFAPESEAMAIVVRDQDRFVAGLPLFKDTSRRPLTVFRLPSNCIVGAGDLLLDPDCDVEQTIATLARHVSRLQSDSRVGVAVAAWEGIDIHSQRWQRLITALRDQGRELHVSRGHDVGVVDILHDWEAYQASWSRNHRSAIKRSRKKLDAKGEVNVQRLRDPSDGELHEILEACFAIEDQSWKGVGGTSILRTPGLREYYHREARMVRDLGMLDLWLLRLGQQIIAFEYCHFAKSTCFSHKISFDPAFERYSPGRVLRCIQLQQYHQDPAADQLDTLGVLCEAKAKWITKSYTSSRCFVATGGPASNWLLRGFKSARRLANRFRDAEATEPTMKPGAARYLETADPSKPSLSRPIPPAPVPAVGTDSFTGGQAGPSQPTRS
jgi:CelD/BcsL family acetyltransferase involved in cellulose biosynthesis